MGREFTQQTTPDLFSTDAQCRQLPSLDQVQEQKTNSTMQFSESDVVRQYLGPLQTTANAIAKAYVNGLHPHPGDRLA
jgi:hypothetical protein